VSDLQVRALATDDERDTFWQLAAAAFRSGRDPRTRGPEWRREQEAAPWHRPDQFRGAFCDGELVGGYVCAERWLLIDGVRLSTGCIGEVVVREDRRKAGIGRALMEDASAFGQERRQALLLLDGISNYYQRFGYADVFDPAWHAFARASALAPSPDRVRAATADDADALLDLYRRHVGAFDRTIEEMRWRLNYWPTPPSVVVDPAGVVRGYAVPPRGERQERVDEVVAEDWPAALALLHHHSALSDSDELIWSIPPAAPLLFWLIDRFDVRSARTYTLNGWWMARPAHRPTLVEQMTPLWRERWPGPGRLPDLAGLSGQQVVQLLFGFRPAASLDPALAPLFRFGGFWIPGSDTF
jgi:predicted N-acetyltransferase YhbS